MVRIIIEFACFSYLLVNNPTCEQNTIIRTDHCKSEILMCIFFNRFCRKSACLFLFLFQGWRRPSTKGILNE